MKNPIFLSDEEENGVAKSAFCWWRTLEDFDEHGNFKADIDLSNLTPRLKVLREMERLAFVCTEGLDDFRHKLFGYKPGDLWLPIGGIKKEEMDIPPVITILLTGLSASGKSAFVNLMYSVLGRSGIIPFAQTSGESSNSRTVYLEEHNVLRSTRNGFCVFDTRGFDEDQKSEGLEELWRWMSEGVRHNQACHREGDDENLTGLGKVNGSVDSHRYAKRKVNFVMVVADLSQIHYAFKNGDLKPVEALKELFLLPAIKKSNENPLLILTHGDTLSAEDRLNGRLKICEYLGIHETRGAYDMPCLTEQGIVAESFDPVTSFALTEAIYRALLQSDRTHFPKRTIREWIILYLSLTMLYLASLFTLLANFFSKLGHRDNKLKNM